MKYLEQAITHWHNHPNQFESRVRYWTNFRVGDITVCKAKLPNGEKALTLSVVNIRKEFRRRGFCTEILNMMERITPDYLIVEHVINANLEATLIARGYKEYPHRGYKNFFKKIR